MKGFWSCFSTAVMLSTFAHADIKPAQCPDVKQGSYSCIGIVNGQAIETTFQISSGQSENTNYLEVNFGDMTTQRFPCIKGKKTIEICSMEERASSDETLEKCSKLDEFAMRVTEEGEVRRNSMVSNFNATAVSLVGPQQILQQLAHFEMKKLRDNSIQLATELQAGKAIFSFAGTCSPQ